MLLVSVEDEIFFVINDCDQSRTWYGYDMGQVIILYRHGVITMYSLSNRHNVVEITIKPN